MLAERKTEQFDEFTAERVDIDLLAVANDVAREIEDDGADVAPDLEMFRSGDIVSRNKPAIVAEFDRADEIFVYAFDPSKTPNPKMTLAAGKSRGEVILKMDGSPVVRFGHAPGIRLSDINLVEVEMQG